MTQIRPGETREPLPGIETALAAAMAGQLNMADFLRQFADSGVIVVSGSDTTSPMTVSSDGVPLVVVFTARDRAKSWADRAPFSTVLLGRAVFENLEPDTGLVVNPGFGLGFEMRPAGVPTILAELQASIDPEIPDPSVELEQAILDAQSGDASPEQLLATFGSSQVYVLSASDDGLSPITFLRDGGPGLVGVFTRPAFAQQFAEGENFALHVEAAWLAASLEEGVGIVVNPGTPAPWELSPDVVAAVGAE
jgi:hypothetical protein